MKEKKKRKFSREIEKCLLPLILVARRNRERRIIITKINFSILTISSNLCMYQIQYDFITL
jgi:hypothetical protein